MSALVPRPSAILGGQVDWEAHVVARMTGAATAADRRPLSPGAALRRGCAVAVCTYRRAEGLARFLDSLAGQQRRPDQLIVVDASPDDETERMMAARTDHEALAGELLYFRVTGPLKGLTRQRNFALCWVETDLVAFFDDDVVLTPDCVAEMERAGRTAGEGVVGVGAYVLDERRRPPLLWRMRRLLGIVPHLQPGRYCRSGMSLPWSFLAPTTDCVEGDWLSGCAMLWRADLARAIGFDETFSGYSNGEDLEFSLRMRAHGRLVVAGTARAWHLRESSGRPNAYQMGYAGLTNLYRIHRHCLDRRTWRDAAWFLYAFGMDTLIRGGALIRPGETWQKIRFLQGRLRFFFQLPRLARSHRSG